MMVEFCLIIEKTNSYYLLSSALKLTRHSSSVYWKTVISAPATAVGILLPSYQEILLIGKNKQRQICFGSEAILPYGVE